MKSIFKTLIEIPTISTDLAANRQAADYIGQFLRVRGMLVQRHEYNGRPALFATTRPTKTPKILLAGHIDVVPAPPESFRMVEKNGRLYGRGAYDMKGAIAAYLQIIDEIKDNLADYDLGIMLTADEELGGEEGVYALLQEGYRAEACVLPDGGENWKLEQAAKGLFWYKLTGKGKAVHGTRHWEGESALEKVLAAIRDIHGEMPANQNAGTTTFNVGALHSGKVFNQVPDHCEADLNFRFTNSQEEQRIRNLMGRICREHDVQARIMTWGPAFSVDMADTYIRAWGTSFQRVMRAPLQTMKSYASSDARWLCQAGITTIVTYPKGAGYHGDDEYVETKALYQLKDIIHDFVESTARQTDKHTDTSSVHRAALAADVR